MADTETDLALAPPDPTTLGLSAPTAETIRDFLANDVESLKRDLADLQRSAKYTATAIERLAAHIETVESVTLDLLASCIEGNASTQVVRIRVKDQSE